MNISKKGISRRKFTKLSAAAAGSLPFMKFQNTLVNAIQEHSETIEVHLFSKHLQFLDFNAMSEAAAEMGFNGLDLTVRPKGHVLPERVSEDLPKAVTAMENSGLEPKMMTTNVWDITQTEQKKVLETASNLGFTYYRTGWLKYPEDKAITESQSNFGQQAKKLEDVNETLDLIGCYQNHAGNHVGAPIWDLPPILETTNNRYIGVQYDIRHAVVEGGSSWELGLKRIKPFIKSIVIKDFKWGIVDGKWKPINTPLGEGMVNFKRYFSLLKEYGINVPVSLHLEYDLGGAEHGATEITMDKKEVFSKMKKDLTFLRAVWEEAE
ncbi:sugar phosphate isomerase/epimerase family protein [Croceitalea marina]|uniref:Sugar phosphate isomerase/epimerase family protein n=1 Tax=Croceitalea marina TaxID=1775166 RepID=A0ABW5MZ84_9FLAO